MPSKCQRRRTATSCQPSDRTIATPDLVTKAYCCALAAPELGSYREDGLDAQAELRPGLAALNVQRDDAGDFEAMITLGVRTP